MNSVTNKTRLAEKRYRDKLKKYKKESRLNTNKQHKKIKIIIDNYKKQKKNTKLQKKPI